MMPEQTIEFRFDTQLLLDRYVDDGEDADDVADELRDEIIKHLEENIKGDSMAIAASSDEDAFGEKANVKVHYHTNEPWQVLEYCRSLGEIYDIVVEDMDRQSRDLKG